MRCQFEAESFLNAHKILVQNNQAFMDQEIARRDSGIRQTLRADVVCLAFSLELFLKDLHLALGGKSLKGHKIRDLFDQLPEEIQVEIFCHHPDKHLITAFLGLHGKTPLDRFKSKIDQVSDGFIKWRYSHEHTALHYEMSFVVDLIKSITAVTNRIDQTNLDIIRAQRSASG